MQGFIKKKVKEIQYVHEDEVKDKKQALHDKVYQTRDKIGDLQYLMGNSVNIAQLKVKQDSRRLIHT